jgi:hypothetical protein
MHAGAVGGVGQGVAVRPLQSPSTAVHRKMQVSRVRQEQQEKEHGLATPNHTKQSPGDKKGSHLENPPHTGTPGSRAQYKNHKQQSQPNTKRDVPRRGSLPKRTDRPAKAPLDCHDEGVDLGGGI